MGRTRLSDRFVQMGLLLSLSLVGIGLGILWLLKQPCPAPKRPRGVPPTVEWVGNCAGGRWVEVASASAGRYQVRIYHDTLGDKEREGWYVLSRECLSRDLRPGQLLERLQAVEGETLVVGGELVGPQCRLVPDPR